MLYCIASYHYLLTTTTHSSRMTGTPKHSMYSSIDSHQLSSHSEILFWIGGAFETLSTPLAPPLLCTFSSCKIRKLLHPICCIARIEVFPCIYPLSSWQYVWHVPFPDIWGSPKQLRWSKRSTHAMRLFTISSLALAHLLKSSCTSSFWAQTHIFFKHILWFSPPAKSLKTILNLARFFPSPFPYIFTNN